MSNEHSHTNTYMHTHVLNKATHTYTPIECRHAYSIKVTPHIHTHTSVKQTHKHVY
uniref:Uncharacterized protein n=1 Tax=Octopus bimaculoides TaxID=37653 RepID=A0A0L8HYK2_OCTBM